jgi:hypothetical protein
MEQKNFQPRKKERFWISSKGNPWFPLDPSFLREKIKPKKKEGS